jgi:parvulin-like peptidyl-prolyl isomerase
MSTALQIGDRTITSTDIIPLLTRYRMMPQLLRENVIDQAIESIECSSEEIENACQQFRQQQQLTSETDLQLWLERHQISQAELAVLATRSLRIEKFKQATWGHKLESYFLTRKSQLDRVIYSVLRVDSYEIACELYYRIAEGEQTFAELARQYSQGPEAITGGMTGPIEMSRPPQVVAQLLAMSQPGQVWTPIQLGSHYLILQLEQFFPARLDEAMRQFLLDELFENWLQTQLAELQPISCELPA